ncbi:hypothetical protein ACRQD2_09555 [Actinotignum sp. GS-2025e]|uniref:hypothetical protein n=1 Tax=Actinotignum TaxID=1653174 RepID=UPI00237D6D77|nr:hypothetical protein [Actinotignum sanguinis]MDE1565784.1 hypothetical protein [Actinotignum sanguinis]MDK7197503.1 hypothetical protein [Actinotignum sanguinis]
MSQEKMGWPREVETTIETIYAVTVDRLPPFVQEATWYTSLDEARAAARKTAGVVWTTSLVTTVSISEWEIHETTPDAGESKES